jgi:hypothetical protein
MNKYNEDKADPQLNLNNLNKEFNIDSDTNQQIIEIKNLRKELSEIDSEIDSDQILLDNINRANRLLDIIETDIINGQSSARLIEVVGQLINAVTSAATSITGISYNQQIIDTKNRALDIKEKELSVKDIIKNADNVNITNNNLVMTREELLKMIEEK